jgi:hypothetical protein
MRLLSSPAPALDNFRILHFDQAVSHHLVNPGQQRVDLLLGFDHFDAHWQAGVDQTAEPVSRDRADRASKSHHNQFTQLSVSLFHE